MLDLASQLRGIPPAPIPDGLGRTHWMDSHPPRILIDIPYLDQDDELIAITSQKSRIEQRANVVFALISGAGESGVTLDQVRAALPAHSPAKIKIALKTLREQGKIRAVLRPGVRRGAVYFDATPGSA